MGAMLADRGIGQRAYEEFKRLSGPKGIVGKCKEIGFSDKVVYDWKNGMCPATRCIVKMMDEGADVMYIMTGRRWYNADRNV